jgi:predicted RNase H-like HicB family nuclease
MKRHFDIVIERDSAGYFIGSVPALPGCHTQARSLDGLMTRMREAIVLWLVLQGAPAAELDFVGVQRIAVEA